MYFFRLIRQDRCHLNGVAIEHGRPAFVSAFSETDTPEGWREHKRDGGVVVHVDSGQIVARGLSMPHSPRVHDGKLWVLDSGNAALLTVDQQTGQADTVAKFTGYARGLAFYGGYAFVGLSQVREEKIFGGVPIAEEEERKCGVSVVELATGRIVAFLEFESTVQEIFDVQILTQVRYPEVVRRKDQDVREDNRIPTGKTSHAASGVWEVL